ncbi:dihydrodipicolinate synthase [Propionibacterium sp. oral taxon 192 str. F0372]|uniref:4-hydroxy-tetrahydrodipicolinate synthase n=1 Tax=Propionibacterium sp. oral taxon 192 TaxID=671222 RepID=UPI0003548E06|nr:4-hydroxy-tetrahydrodipicolinate synthase [Propionibacterium sp. oral taxon 192]EPH02502.1 dihydrodipicolinate synthase [Propionibacterium sp. oral taxon 192 str. F0372]
MSEPILGRLITAMVTPFDASGAVDPERAEQLAVRLVDEQRNDSVLVNGTTGEAPTTSDAEKCELIRVVKAAVGDRAKVIAGVGTFNTAHSVELAKASRDAGADALLTVTPYYSLPPQEALVAHFRTIASATDLPMVLYDIPHRAGRPIETPSLIALAEHPNIVGVKDAKNDIVASSQVMAATGLDYYAGDDAKLLPMLAVGAAGVVGTSTHFTGRRTAELIRAWLDGDHAKALAIHREMLPVYTGVFVTQGVMMVKAGLAHQGFDVGGLRSPMIWPTDEVVAGFTALLDSIVL